MRLVASEKAIVQYAILGDISDVQRSRYRLDHFRWASTIKIERLQFVVEFILQKLMNELILDIAGRV